MELHGSNIAMGSDRIAGGNFNSYRHLPITWARFDKIIEMRGGSFLYLKCTKMFSEKKSLLIFDVQM